MKITEIFNKIITNLEDSNLPVYYFLFTFISALTLRTFFEFFSDHTEISLPMMLHYYSFYAAIGLSTILLIYFFTKEKIYKIFKLISTGFLVLIIAPIIDLLLSKGAGINMSYYNGDLVYGFITFFGKLSDGVTPGIRIEIALIILVLFFYFRLKKLGFIKSLIGIFLFYCLIFFYGSLFIFLKFVLGVAGISFVYSNYVFINVFLLLIILSLIVLAFLINRKIFLSIFRDLRFSRIFYYWLMFFFGFLWSWQATKGFRLDSENIFYLPFILVGIFFACIFSIITNNIVDVDIDKISNKDRPLIKNEIDINIYKKIGWLALAISLVYALSVNLKVFFLILFFIGNYFIYSMPPLRIKRVFFFSKIIILLNSLAMIILGFVAFNNNLGVLGFQDIVASFGENVNHFSIVVIISVTLFLLASNFIDIKDYEGDKAGNIETLPTVLGLKISKFLIGLSFLLLYAVVGFLLKNWLIFAGLLIIGIIQFFLINRKKYQEKYVFGFFLVSLLVILYAIF